MKLLESKKPFVIGLAIAAIFTIALLIHRHFEHNKEIEAVCEAAGGAWLHYRHGHICVQTIPIPKPPAGFEVK